MKNPSDEAGGGFAIGKTGDGQAAAAEVVPVRISKKFYDSPRSTSD
jgi:hypothetical protein